MKKRILALLLVILLFVSVFAGCNNNSATDDPGQGTSNGDKKEPDTKEPEDTDPEDGDPEELEPLTLTFLQKEGNTKTYTEAIQAGYATMFFLDEMALEQNNLVVERMPVLTDAYTSTVSGYIASQSLPDGFYTDVIDEAMFLNYASAGFFAELDDLLTHSNGLSRDMLMPGGAADYIRATQMLEDGTWYRMGTPDGNGTFLVLDTDEVDYINNWPVHTWYNMAIRKDWLDKCGLAMPKTTEEYKNALVAFQDGDMNGNGTKDERAFLAIGHATDYNAIFGNGVAQWFGMPTGLFSMNPATGEYNVALEAPTYVDYVTYLKELYDLGLAYTGEGGAWSYSVNIASNAASSYVMYPTRMTSASNEASTGDPNAQYDQMPVIQAIEGVKPTILGQTATQSLAPISFNPKCNYDAAAAYIDFIYSEVFYMTLMYGLEGKGWEYDAAGNFKKIVMTDQDEDYSYGDCWHYLAGNFWPQVQLGWIWDPLKNEYHSFEDAMDNGEPYTYLFLTEEEWKEANAALNWDNYSPLKQYYESIVEYGVDNLKFWGPSVSSPATSSEADIIGAYQSDLTTYLPEMTTSYITGAKSIDQFDADLQHAYDALGLAEYIAAQQGKINRFFEAVGRDAFAG